MAHAVVLASGTLAPVALLQQQLFPSRDVRHFSCGHVIAREQLLALALGRSPTGSPLDFRHATRSSPQLIEQLGRLLLSVCQVVPQASTGLPALHVCLLYRLIVQDLLS